MEAKKMDHIELRLLYHIWHVNEDRSMPPLSLVGLCKVIKSDVEYGDPEIVDWQRPYSPPSLDQLTVYHLGVMRQWYHVTYELPEIIRNASNMFATASEKDMTEMYTIGLPENSLLFNTTRKMFFWLSAHNQWKPTMSSHWEKPLTTTTE